MLESTRNFFMTTQWKRASLLVTSKIYDENSFFMKLCTTLPVNYHNSLESSIGAYNFYCTILLLIICSNEDSYIK